MGQALEALKQNGSLPSWSVHHQGTCGHCPESLGSCEQSQWVSYGLCLLSACSSSFRDHIAQFLKVQLIFTHFLTAVSVICH